MYKNSISLIRKTKETVAHAQTTDEYAHTHTHATQSLMSK